MCASMETALMGSTRSPVTVLLDGKVKTVMKVSKQILIAQGDAYCRKRPFDTDI